MVSFCHRCFFEGNSKSLCVFMARDTMWPYMENDQDSNRNWFTQRPVVKMHCMGANKSLFCSYNLSKDFSHIKKKKSFVESKEGFNWPMVKGLSILALEADILIFILPLLLANVKGWESDSVSTGGMSATVLNTRDNHRHTDQAWHKSVCSF